MPKYGMPQWFYDAKMGDAPRGRSPGKPYPAEGELVGMNHSCGEPMRYVYGYKRRRPTARCLRCNPL